MSERKTPYRVLVVIGGTLMMFAMGIFYAWSRYRMILHPLFPDWTYSNMSLNFSLFICMMCIGGMLGSILIAKFGYCRIMRTGAFLALIGLILFSFIGHLSSKAALLMMYFSYGILSPIGCGFVYNGVISGTARHFPEKSGAVTGLLLTGYGLSSMTVGSLVASLAETIGIFAAFRIVAVVLFAIIFTLTGLYKKAPEQSGGESAETSENDGFTGRETIRTPAFWLLVVWMIITSCQGLMVINSAAEIAQGFGVAASLGLIVSLFNGVSRVGAGALLDRTDLAPLIDTLIAMGGAVSLLFASKTESVVLMFAGLILTGIAYGGSISLNAGVTKSVFGARHYSQNFALANLSGPPAAFLGPVIAGALQDRAGGGYETTYIAMVFFGIVSIVICVVMTIMMRKLKK